jgi:cellulose synthase/poly-beta-1,6-N-acetylglucosamine synthase-like glycosyltransferase
MNSTIRQIHRWLSIVFTVTVIICFVALTGILPFWVFYLPLLPLFLQMLTGLYMFALPYVTGRRAAPAS